MRHMVCHWYTAYMDDSITEHELRAQLREKEVVKYDEVKLAKLEGDGRLSVIKARS